MVELDAHIVVLLLNSNLVKNHLMELLLTEYKKLLNVFPNKD